MARIKCILLMPLRRNDGSAVSRAELRGIFTQFLDEFDGYTVAGEVEGGWRSPEGVVFRDRHLQVWVVVDSSQLPALRRTVQAIGRQFGQEAMYLEITEGKVEIVPVRRRRNRGRPDHGN